MLASPCCHQDGADDATSVETHCSSPASVQGGGGEEGERLRKEPEIEEVSVIIQQYLREGLILCSSSGKRNSSEIRIHSQIEAWETWSHPCSSRCSRTLT